MPILLELPLSVVQGAHLPGFEPPRDAVEMKGVVTDSPSNRALFRSSWCLVGLTLDTKIHNVVPADGTVINHNIPGAEGHCIPLFNFKALLGCTAVGASGDIHTHRCRHFGNTWSVRAKSFLPSCKDVLLVYLRVQSPLLSLKGQKQRPES